MQIKFWIVVTSSNLLFNNIPWIIIFCKKLFCWTVMVWLPKLSMMRVRTWWRLFHERTWWRLFHERTWWRLFQKRVVRITFDIYVSVSTYTNPMESAHGHFVYLPNKYSKRQVKACICLKEITIWPCTKYFAI